MRDENGEWICGFAAHLGYCSSVQAELWGAWYGLKMTWDRWFHKVVLELDNLIVVNWIT